MTIVFLSNYLNHHQKPLADELSQKDNIEFYFVATKEMSIERTKLGYEECKADYLIRAYESEKSLYLAREIINDADILMYGSAPFSLIRKRKKDGKMIIVCSERLFKRNDSILQLIVKAIKYRYRFLNYKNAYLLCNGAYSAIDYNRIGLFLGKTYKWGYFPAYRDNIDIRKIIDTKKKNSLVWVGRFIEWKYPEVPVLVAEFLENMGIDFELRMIGNGILEEKIKRMVSEKNISHRVLFLGGLSPKQVISYLDESEICLVSSDRNEGYGVIVNEAMGSGCVVIANSNIGVAPYLIENRTNGFVYENYKVADICKIIVKMMEDDNLRKKVAIKSYMTIKDLWNPKIASERLAIFLQDLLKHGECDRYLEGPCCRDIGYSEL